MCEESDYIERQYANVDRLAVRIHTHLTYTRPQIDFVAWVVDRVSWQGEEWVIDVGAGDGQYGREIGDRCRVYLAADRYMGMLRDLPAADWDGHSIALLNLDAAEMPLADRSLDVVMANHMLYYVEDLDRVIGELARILPPAGRLLAATNSEFYMQELRDLHRRVAIDFGYDQKLGRLLEGQGFTLENGRPALERHFGRVECFELASALVFTESEPVVDYLASFGDRLFDLLPVGVRWDDVAEALGRELDAHIAVHGAFRVSKLAGVFVCQKEAGRR